MARSNTLLGNAKVYQRPDGTLAVDTDSLRRARSTGRYSGYDDDDVDFGDADNLADDWDDDFGDDDDDDFGDDWDDDFGDDDDDDFGDDDDDVGDADNLADDDDDVGARRRRRRRRRRGPRGRRRPGRRASRGGRRPRRGSSRAAKMKKYKYPTTVSATGTSAAIIAAAGQEAETLQLTPTVTVRLNDLRLAFDPPQPVVAGSNAQFRVTQVRVGDTLIWNDTNGVDSRLFSGDTTLRHMLKGRMATPAQPIFIAGVYVNNGSVATATLCTVSATVTAFKKAVC